MVARPESEVTGHFGHRTLRTRTRHFGTGDEVSQVSGHFGTKNVVRDTSAPVSKSHFGTGSRKSRDTSEPGQYRRDTAPPVIRLKLGAEVSKWFGAELSGHFGRNVLWPKCPASVSRAECFAQPCTTSPYSFCQCARSANTWIHHWFGSL